MNNGRGGCLFACTPTNPTDRGSRIQLLTLRCHTTDHPPSLIVVSPRSYFREENIA